MPRRRAVRHPEWAAEPDPWPSAAVAELLTRMVRSTWPQLGRFPRSQGWEWFDAVSRETLRSAAEVEALAAELGLWDRRPAVVLAAEEGAALMGAVDRLEELETLTGCREDG